jgi:hypothetical protein
MTEKPKQKISWHCLFKRVGRMKKAHYENAFYEIMPLENKIEGYELQTNSGNFSTKSETFLLSRSPS